VIVTATASARSAGRLRSYGADRIIDYTAIPLPQAVAGQRFDAVLNLVRTDPQETAQLASLVARVDAGDLKIDVAARRPLTELAAVHDEALAGCLAGKTVLIP
jgi:NADPH:quinone reductase-like Zn-dependent oxidoreductase